MEAVERIRNNEFPIAPVRFNSRVVDAKYDGPVCLEVIGPELTMQKAQSIAAESYGYMNAILKMLGTR